ncbi:shikimate kinase [Virgibacillus halodenitrificans]|uniref:Shikimate kinase n=1 Tax=Virgibacillus halodenitrificans TaxID=1482 RepID=A0AAC9NMN2_VIRHA|nr:AAA family ATPase [Virgibacillus halodenitrificans]APC49869.1 shikimate kinase [Virgibacillus halodenitrificans]
MKLVLIFGPQAVGKMTVGQELAKLTNLKLMHNHMTIDLLEPLFGFSPELWKLSNTFREEIFRSFAKTDQDGIIFTFVWAFNKQEDWENVEHVCTIFREKNAEIYFVELEAKLDIRLKRNKTANRLEHKPTKRNINQSEQNLLNSSETLRLNSREGELKRDNYVRIDNNKLSAVEVAERIKEHFEL